MNLSTLYEKLEKIFIIDDCRSIISAVSADPIAWSTLTDPVFLQHFIEAYGDQKNAWTIAGIVLFSLGIKLPADNKFLSGENYISHDSQIKGLPTSDIYNKVLQNILTPYLASEAGMLTLEMVDRLDRGMNYQSLVDEVLVSSTNRQKPGKLLAAWKTAFSALFNLVADTGELLKSLITTKYLIAGEEVYLHILLTQQLNDVEIQQIVKPSLEDSEIETQVDLLKSLYQSRYRHSVKDIAHNAIQKSIEPILEEVVQSSDYPSHSDLINDISRYKAIADIYHLAEKPEFASGLYQLVERLTKKYLNGVNIQANEVEYVESKPAISGMLDQVEKRYDLQLDIAAEHTKISVDGDATNISNNDNNGSDQTNSLYGKHFKESVLVNPFRVKHSLVNTYIASLSIDKLPDSFFDTINPVTQLVSVEPGPAKQLIEVARKNDDVAHALEMAYHIYLHYPEDIDNLRTLAALHELGNDHVKAYQYLQTVTSMQTVSVEDWLNYGRVSHQLGYLQEAKTGFTNAIKMDDANGKAYAHLGRVYSDLGEKTLAENNLNHATIIAPYDESVWLLLAGYYQISNENERLITALRSAHIAVPNSQSIQFELADTCLNLGYQAEGMQILDNFAKLVPEDRNLVKKVFALANANKVSISFTSFLQQAYLKWPTDTEILYLYAKQLEETGKFSDALELLVKHQSDQFSSDFIHLAVKLLMHLWLLDTKLSNEIADFSERILVQLEKLVIEENRDPEFELDLADINLISDNLERGFTIYQDLINIQDEKFTGMHWRMHRGLAIIAAQSNKFDAALAAINTAIQEIPSEETLYLLLARFNFQDQRLYEAKNACDLLLSITQNRTDTLAWIIAQMKQAKQYGRAIELLRGEVKHDPLSLPNNLQLTELLILSGELKDALETLEKLIPVYADNNFALQQISYLFHDLGEAHKSIDVYKMSLNGKSQLSLEDYFTYAYLLLLDEKYQDSQDVIQKGIELYPEEKNLEVLLAEISLYRKDYGQCISQLVKLRTNIQQGNISSEKHIPDELIFRLVDKRHQMVFTHETGIVYRLAKCYLLTKNYREARQLVAQELKKTPGDLILLDYLSFLENEENRSTGDNLLNVLFDPESYDISKLSDTQITALSAIIVRKLLADTQNDSLSKSSADINLLGKLKPDSQYSRLFTAWEGSRLNEYSVSKINLAQMVKNVTNLIDLQSKSYKVVDLGLEASNYAELSVDILCQVLCENYQWNQALALVEMMALEFSESPSLAKLRIDILGHWYVHSNIAKECNISNTRKIEFSIAEKYVNQAYKSLELFDSSELKAINDKYLFLLELYFKKKNPEMDDLVKLTDKYSEIKPLVSILIQNGEYQKALDLIPENYTDLTSVLLKALAALRLGLPEALNYSEAALSVWPDNPIALYLYALVNKNAGVTDNALRFTLRAIEIWPEELKWAKDALSLSRDAGDTQSELYVLEKITGQAPFETDLINRLGDLYTRIDEPEKAINTLERYLADRPKDVDTWAHLAELFVHGSNYSSAITTIKQGLKHNSESQVLKIKHGKLLLKTQDYAKSEVVLKECINQEPENILARYALIDTYLSQNKNQEAEGQLDSISAKNINSESDAVVYVHLVNKIQGPQFARKFINDYLEGRSKDLTDAVYFVLAEIDYSEGNFVYAERNAQQAIKINPENGPTLGLLGRINRKLGNLDQSIYYLVKAIEMQDPALDDLLELGRSYIDRREIKLALEAFKRAVFQYPERPEPYFLTAQVMRDCKDYVSAEKMLRKAAALAPGDLTIHRQLGAIIALNLVHNT